MATAPLTTDAISANIQLAQKLLKKEKGRLNELRELIIATQENIEHLEQALQRYRAAVTPSPIRRCPPEILGMVFQFLAVDYEDLHVISLVCKQWHDLVLQDPLLWSTIRVELPYNEWNMKSWALSSRSYIRKCLERSRSSRLRVELDLSPHMTTREQLIEMISSGAPDLTRYTISYTDQDTITEWLCDLDYGDLEDLEIVSNWEYEHVIDLVDELIGPDGQFTMRWDSLDIEFPENELASLLWEKLAAHVANLSCLRIRISEYDIAESPWISTPTWDLPNVKSLEATGLRNWPRFLSLNPASLQRLSVDMSLNNEDLFSELACFVQLRSLTMTIRKAEDSALPSEEYSMSFPLLQELIFEGDIRQLHQLKWNCPNLKRLALCCATDEIMDIRDQSNWRQLRPSEVHWEPPILFNNNWKAPAVQDVLRFFLLQFTSSERLSVPLKAKDTLLVDLLEKLSNDGSLPPNLKTISFHNGYGKNKETVSVKKLWERTL